MKIDQNTIAILKNFSKINPGIVIEEGNRLKTVSNSKTIIGLANVSTVFPKKFGIYNLNRFLSTLNLFDDPELDFKDNYVKVKSNNKSLNYVYTDTSLFQHYPYPEYTLPTRDINFTITVENLKDLSKALDVLSFKQILITGEDGKICLKASSEDKTSQDLYSIEIGETDKTFKAVLKSENLEIITDTYDVTLCKKGSSHFKSDKVEYYIVLEATSTF